MDEDDNLASDEMMACRDFKFPAGGKISLGEQSAPDGPTLYLAMTAAGASEPSLAFSIDPISFQSMITYRSGPDGQRTVPLDKLIGSLRNAGTGSLLTGR